MTTDEEKTRAAADKNSVGRLLVDGGFVTQEQLQEALMLADTQDLKLGQALLQLGYVRKKTLVQVLRLQKRKNLGFFGRVRNALALADVAEQHTNEALEAAKVKV